jgi:hypothetical protein
MAPTTITVEDVERFRTRDPRAQTLVRERQVIRDDTASTMAEAVYTVASERVALHLVPGGCTTAHNCPECEQDRPCFRRWPPWTPRPPSDSSPPATPSTTRPS